MASYLPSFFVIGPAPVTRSTHTHMHKETHMSVLALSLPALLAPAAYRLVNDNEALRSPGSHCIEG